MQACMYVHIMLMYIYIHILCSDYIIAANSEMKKIDRGMPDFIGRVQCVSADCFNRMFDGSISITVASYGKYLGRSRHYLSHSWLYHCCQVYFIHVLVRIHCFVSASASVALILLSYYIVFMFT